MSTNVCASCGRMVDKLITMAGQLWKGEELCIECAQPIVDYLQEYGLLEAAGMAHLSSDAELQVLPSVTDNSQSI